MKSFKEFCASYDNLLFRQMIENHFNLNENSLDDEKVKLLIEQLDKNNIFTRITNLNEDYLLTGKDDDSTTELGEINREIYKILTDFVVEPSDFDQKKLCVSMEGLDFSSMMAVLKSIDGKIDSDKK